MDGRIAAGGQVRLNRLHGRWFRYYGSIKYRPLRGNQYAKLPGPRSCFKKCYLSSGNTEFSTDTAKRPAIRNRGWPDVTYVAEIISARCLNIQSTQTWGMGMESGEDPKIYQYLHGSLGHHIYYSEFENTCYATISAG